MSGVYDRMKRLDCKNRDRGSTYSVVSCSDLTPGSLEIWIDLPEEIKYDPALAPFKQLYDRSHGNQDLDQLERKKSIFNKQNEELLPIGEPKENENPNKEAEEKFLTPLDIDEDKVPKSPRKQQLAKAFRIVKLVTLVSCWTFIVVALVLNNERPDPVLHTVVSSSDVKEYDLGLHDGRVRVLVSLSGPFLKDRSLNVTASASTLMVWLHREPLHHDSDDDHGENTSVWSIPLLPGSVLDFAESTNTFHKFSFDETVFRTDPRTSSNDTSESHVGNTSREATVDAATESKLVLRMRTSDAEVVSVTMEFTINPLDEETGVIYAAILLGFLYIFIIFEIVNRTLAALLTSSLGIAVLAAGGARPTMSELMSWLDVETLLLLFSMMLLVSILAETGVFDYLAVLAFEYTRGRTWPLINCLCLFTAVFSTFLDNVTTVLLITPVTIRLCEVMHLNPIPVLMCMVIFSNVGGAATPVGDPPNVIIATHPSVIKEGINFASFTLHMGVGILLVAVQTYLQLRYMFRNMNKLRHTVPQDVIELRQEILIWRRAAASLASYSRDEDLVRKALQRKVNKLTAQLRRRETGGGSRVDPDFNTKLADIKEKYRIRDMPLLIKSMVAVGFVVLVFFLHAIPELQRISLGWTALLGAVLLLLLAEREDIEPILARVEWSTLLFFAALFVLMEVLSKLGLISWIGDMTERVILMVGEESTLAVAILLVLWVSGLASAFVDNIPLTTMMVRVTASLADPTGLGLPLAPLAWAMSFGACLGGNGTLIGASANVVCAGVAEQHGYRITFVEFIKTGFPVMVGNLIVATIYLMICHVAFTWH